ncbi:MAG: hypothetical protein RIS76_1138 [Verrucomicrobiota bacterium]|jgi:lactoylglutathione lyase
MKQFSRSLRILAGTLALVGISALTAPSILAADATNEFRKPTIDLGMFVKNADQTARFLTNAIGFRELPGFSVPAAMGSKIGLVDGQPFTVRVFALDDVDQATRIKVLSFPNTEGKPPDQAFVHSMLGMRYLTLYVKDMTRALERLKAEKVPLMGETPVDLGGGTLLVAVRDPDGNFYELIGPRR